ncbi:MAG: hypothetical protein Phog2KO_32820 [Phototrophicaceae bacterium]
MTQAKRYIINVQGAIYRDNQYLISKRSEREDFMPGIIGLAGGKIDISDEQAEDVLLATLAREIHEEVNVVVDNFQLVTTNYFEADNVPVINLVFLCRYVSGEAHATDPNEVEEVYWMTIDEVLAHPKCMPWTQSYLCKAEALRKKS